MELSSSGTVVMATCNGRQQQRWIWKQRGSNETSLVRKKKSHKAPVVTSTSPVRRVREVAQELAVGDY